MFDTVSEVFADVVHFWFVAVLSMVASTGKMQRISVMSWLALDEYKIVFKSYVGMWEKVFWDLYEVRKKYNTSLGDKMQEEVRMMAFWSDAPVWHSN